MPIDPWTRRFPWLTRGLSSSCVALSIGVPAMGQSWPGIEMLEPPVALTPGLNQAFGVAVAVLDERATVGDHGESVVYMYRRGSAGGDSVHDSRGPAGSSFGYLPTRRRNGWDVD